MQGNVERSLGGAFRLPCSHLSKIRVGPPSDCGVHRAAKCVRPICVGAGSGWRLGRLLQWRPSRFVVQSAASGWFWGSLICARNERPGDSGHGPRRSRNLTRLCSPEPDPPSAQVFVLGWPKKVIKGAVEGVCERARNLGPRIPCAPLSMSL
jgi:hypothetical protein